MPAAKSFAVACIFGGLWALGVIGEISATELANKVLWIKFQALWKVPVTTAITCFVLQYAGLGHRLTTRTYVILVLMALVSTLLSATNDFHHLIWTGFQVKQRIIMSPTRLHWFFHSYIYLLGFINLVVLVRLAVISPSHRLPVAIILAGQIIGRVGYTLFRLDPNLVGPGEAVFFIVGVGSLGYALAILCFHAIDPVAPARRAALEQMSEGMFVLDLEGRIADVNPMAAAMLGIPKSILRQKLLTEVIPIQTGVLERLESGEPGPAEITLSKDNSDRQYTLNLTPLRGRRRESIGRLLLLHDVTEQKRAQARILEQKGVVAALREREHLARELHDGISQVLGYVNVQVQTSLKRLRDGDNGKADSLLERTLAVTRDAHADIRESILGLRSSSDQQWSFIPVLQKYIAGFQKNYGIHTELSLGDGIGENTFDPAAEVQLLRVIQEALTNARKHSGAQNLRVSLERNDGRASITISDDGHGFDAGRLQPGDGNHFGLLIMRERMAQIGGALQIESSPGGGASLRLDIPVRDRGREHREITPGR